MTKHKHFYHHLVIIDSIHLGLDELELEPHEKEELLELVDKNIHHAVVDTILSELEAGDKKVFLALVFGGDHDQIWKMLTFKVHDVEEKIRKVANELISKFHEDIKEAHSSASFGNASADSAQVAQDKSSEQAKKKKSK